MKKLLTIIIFLYSINLSAQDSLGIGGFGFLTPQDTVAGGSTDTYNVWVVNYGPGTFSGPISLYTAIRDSVAPSGIDTVSSTPASGTLSPGDSMLVSVTANYTISATGYKYGIDVIVIWPVAANAITRDSLEFSVIILDESGIQEYPSKQLLKAYPNPSSDIIRFQSGLQSVESIVIYDLSGRKVLSASNASFINIGGLENGMYTSVVILADNKRYSIPIIKMEK